MTIACKMNTSQLDTIMKLDPVSRNCFLGVYPSDLLPARRISYLNCLIANVDSHYLPGSHWVAFYFTSSGDGEFFYSYGNPPSYYSNDFTRFISRGSRNSWTYNSKPLQGEFSSVCGEYTIFFLQKRNRGMTLKQIANIFTKNTSHNDRMVWRFCKKRFHGIGDMKLKHPSFGDVSRQTAKRKQRVRR